MINKLKTTSAVRARQTLTIGAARPGCQPLGITFELVTGDRPADRVPPGSASTTRPYFEPKR